MKLRTIEGLDLRGKYVLLRDDFNVQIVDGKITEGFRTSRIPHGLGPRHIMCMRFGKLMKLPCRLI